MYNPYFSWIFQQQPQQIKIKSPQDGQDLTITLHPGQSVPKMEELNRVEAKPEILEHQKNIKDLINEALSGPSVTHKAEKNECGRPKAKLNAEKINEHLNKGLTQKEIGKIYNCSDRTIRNILKRKKSKTWDI